MEKLQKSSKDALRTLLAALLVAGAAFAPAGAQGADIRVFTAGKGLPSGWVTALAAAPDGRIWVGTGDAGVVSLDPGTGVGKAYRATDGLGSDRVFSIALFRGKVYVGTADGVSILDGASWTTVRKVENVTMRDVRLSASPDGKELWACSVHLAGGTVRFDGSSWKFMGGEGRGLFNDIEGFAFTGEAILLASGSGAVYRYQGGDYTAFGSGLPPVNLFAVAYSGGKAYLGTSRGLFEESKGWKPVPLPGTTGRTGVFSLATLDGTVYAGGSYGLAKVSAGKVDILNETNGLPSSRVLSVAAGKDFVAAGTAGGLAVIRGW